MKSFALTCRRAAGSVPAERASQPATPRQSASAVGLRQRFRLHTNNKWRLAAFNLRW